MKIKSFLTASMTALALTACSFGTPTPPEAIMPVPSEAQLKWHQTEMYAFVHFGLNTFNDLEWGYGDTPAETFNPTDLNPEQWVQLFKEIGMKGVILTAKHHDGFCLWQTETTDYSVKNSPWKDGKGDVVKELSDACHKHGLKFGIYLSPWDRNNAYYAQEEYVQTYHNQIRELSTNYGELFEFWFDGANGGDGYYGGARERRSIDPIAYYDYAKARDIIHENNPEAMIFGGTCQTIRWVGNESGWAGDTHWSIFATEGADEGFNYHYTESQWGNENGPRWLGSETDVSVRPGWFYHAREDHQLKSVSKLLDIYYRSVGHNSNLILNFPIALSGRVHPNDSARLVEWANTLREDFKTNLLTPNSVKISASNTRGSKFLPSNVLTETYDSFWSTDDSVSTGTLDIDFTKPTTLNRLILQEYIPLGQRVRKFTVETLQADGTYAPIESVDTLSTIGYKRILRFKTVETSQIRISFLDSRGPLCINRLQAFLAPPVMELPSVSRNAEGVVTFSNPDNNVQLLYTTDGTEPTPQSTQYTAPFNFNQKGVIKVACYDPVNGKISESRTVDFDIPSSDYKVLSEDEKAKKIIDGNDYSVYFLPKEKPQISLELSEPKTIIGFRYTPDQSRDGDNYISHYSLLLDNKVVKEGEFSNIMHNPVMQEILFDEEFTASTVTFKATRLTPNSKFYGVAEFSLITK